MGKDLKNKEIIKLSHNETEDFIENWLNEHKNWFKSYAIENLDLNTVEKWLRLNNKHICKCEKISETSSFTRRKSLAAFTQKSIDRFKSMSKTNEKLVINHNLLSFNKEKSEIIKKTKRSSSFNILLKSESSISESTSNDSESKTKAEKTEFFLDSKNEVLDDNNDEKEKNSNKNTQLLKSLIKSRIKLPNKRLPLTLDEKLKMKKIFSNKYELLCNIIQDTSKEMILPDLTETILTNLKILIDCEYSSLFYFDRVQQRLVSFKYDLLFENFSSHKINQNPCVISLSLNDYEQEIPIDSCYLESIVQKSKLLVINPDQIKENTEKFGLKKLNCEKLNSIICMPIVNVDKEVIGVIQLTNKSKNQNFDEKDLKLLEQFTEFCATVIVKCQIFDLCSYEYERIRTLLEVLHDLFQQQTDLDKIFFMIMQKAQMLLKCQRCSILIQIDDQENINDNRCVNNKTFDVFEIGNRPEHKTHSIEKYGGGKISKDLIDFVITTGNKINLSDAYLDPRFDPSVDNKWTDRTKSKLIVPILNVDGSIIGCVRVSNRIDNQPFDENDEQLLETFSIFCGLGISNTLIYNQLEKSMAEKTVALEVLSYHAVCSKTELDTFLKKMPADENFININKAICKEQLSSYLFDDFCLNSDEMVLASYEMFKQSGLMKTFKIDKKTLLLWLSTVRKNYRNIEYHNWSHAFNVTQSMFSIFANSSISGYLQDIEKLALLVGCLCHDLDHRGTNNLFQIESHSALSTLYGTTATMEKHHFNHCIMILNSPDHNIFANVKPKNYQLLISFIKEAILATDLADHFSIRNEFAKAVQDKNIYWTEESHTKLLRKSLMTSCDLASVAKPWSIHRKVVNLVTSEFFAQGEKERLELNIEPNIMMDVRKSHELPRLQIQWIDNVCQPLFNNFAILCNSFNGHLKRMKENRRNWSMLYEKYEKDFEKKKDSEAKKGVEKEVQKD